MNYYPHHIGDYRSATMHLTNDEDLAYRRLLEMYYDTERPIPVETQWVSRRLRLPTEAIENVLKDFFSLTENGWSHERCEREIADYRATARRNAENGKKGGRPRKDPMPERASSKVDSAIEKPNGNPEETQTKPSGFPVGSQSEPTGKATKNQEPRTINQEPETHTQNPEPRVAGAVCVALRSEGMAQVNPSHPELLNLLDQGARIEDFISAGRIAKDRNKGFAYVLGIVKSQLADAKRMAEEAANAPPVTQRKAKDPPWWASEQSINAKASTLGLRARPGEDMANFKARIEEAIRKVEGATA